MSTASTSGSPASAPAMGSALSGALGHLRRGELAAAEAGCRQILATEPGNAGALNLLGIVLNQANRKDEALAAIQRAVACQPTPEYHKNLSILFHDRGDAVSAEAHARQAIVLNADYAEAHYSLGNALLAQNKLDEAAASFQNAINRKPDYTEAYNNLGGAYRAQRKLPEAVAACERVIHLTPNNPQAHSNLGSLLRDMQKLDLAIAAYQRAILFAPNYAEAHDNLGSALAAQSRHAEAVDCFRRAIELRPDLTETYFHLGTALQALGRTAEAAACYERVPSRQNSPDAINQLGTILQTQGKIEEAIAQYEKALAIAPKHAGALNNLGYAYSEQNKLEQAIACYRKALETKPDFAEVYNNLGNAYRDLGDIEQALTCYQRTVLFQPDSLDGHWNRSLALLLKGDFAQGWPEYEWRWLRFKDQKRSFPQPLWDGSPLKGRTILLHTEQGFGDSLQFIRYAAQVKERGGRVILESDHELTALLATAPAIAQAFSRGQPLPPFDFHIPLMSLPLVLESTLATVPAAVPYLTPSAEKVEEFRKLLSEGGPAGKLKVGIAWAGRPVHKNDRNRSLALVELLPILSVPEVAFVSLQKGPATGQLKDLPAEVRVLDLSPHLRSFADTAGAMMNLDLVISVDTSVVHLAGALGRPVWTLLPFSPDWRWLLERTDSPWYPTMKLFRQPTVGDWRTVIQTVAGELRGFAERVVHSPSR